LIRPDKTVLNKHSLKAGIHYVTFALIYSLFKSDTSCRKSESADFGHWELTDFTGNHVGWAQTLFF